MSNLKTENDRELSMKDKSLNLVIKSIINTELSIIKQDLLFFKNDILKDVRKMKENFKSKFAEQNVTTSERFDVYEKKIDSLSTQISLFNTMSLNNSDFSEKIIDFQQFKSKTEEQFNNLNCQINIFQKEYRDYLNNIEKLINENLRYLGVIGRSAKFTNFRSFIDYILKYFKEFNEFKKEMKDYDFKSFQKNINSQIQEFRSAINNSYRSSYTLIESKNKEFDKKLADLIKNNKKVLEEYEEKLKELKNNFYDYLSKYKTHFTNIENNINEKYKEQFNKIENLKNKFMNDINNIKSLKNINKNIKDKRKEELEDNIINNNFIYKYKQISKENNNIDNFDINNDKLHEKIILLRRKSKLPSRKIKSPQNESLSKGNNNQNLNRK